MFTILALGFLIGMKHAVEADHVAAVASLATRARSVGETTRFGIAWGVGHTLTLFAVGGVVLILDTAIPDTFAQVLEFAVGIMLIGLGIDVILRMARKGAHLHGHAHDGKHHVHAHIHKSEAHHDAPAHSHIHPARLPVRALLVGFMHGMAGSAALVILALTTVETVWQGIAYIILFGAGSVIGMAALSCAIALPMHFTAHRLTWAWRGIAAALGLVTVMLGATIAWQIGVTEGLVI